MLTNGAVMPPVGVGELGSIIPVDSCVPCGSTSARADARFTSDRFPTSEATSSGDRVTAPVPVRVSLRVSDGFESWAIEFPDFALQHAVPLLGIKPSDQYNVEVSITDEAGTRTVLSPTLVAATGPLPADFPVISVYYSDQSRMEPGLTLMDKTRRFGSTGGTYAIIVDNAGTVRW